MEKYLDSRVIIALGLVFTFLANSLGIPPVYASAYAEGFILPAPGQMVALSPAYSPAVLKGIKLDPKNPFRFHFFVDQGDSSLSQEELKQESAKLIKYFLASLTIPEKDLWVNLSPYEKDRIVPQEFGRTEMGRDLLAEDYLLKQITASLIYPESQLGKKFWQKVYTKAQAKYGTTNIPINTFNKVWIVPDKAVVYEDGGVAFVLENHLKVMLEQDYLSMAKHKDTNQLGSQIVREIVIPALTKEVNEGKNFAQLRQVFYSLILATWYKKKIKDSILNKVYSNRNKIDGVNISAGDKDRIYQEYLRAFKKGVFNYIQEGPDQMTGQSMPRKYFSGGVMAKETLDTRIINPVVIAALKREPLIDEDVLVRMDGAMTNQEARAEKFYQEFWANLGINESRNMTKSFGLTGESVKFSHPFRFEDGYKPGQFATGLGVGSAGDEVWVRRNAYGEIIFELRRAQKVISTAVWAKVLRNKVYVWEYMGEENMWMFWTGRLKSIQITGMLGVNARIGQFNGGFSFEPHGYQPGVKAIGVGLHNDEIWMKNGEHGERIFDGIKVGQISKTRTAVWIKTTLIDKTGEYIWVNEKDKKYKLISDLGYLLMGSDIQKSEIALDDPDDSIGRWETRSGANVMELFRSKAISDPLWIEYEKRGAAFEGLEDVPTEDNLMKSIDVNTNYKLKFIFVDGKLKYCFLVLGQITKGDTSARGILFDAAMMGRFPGMGTLLDKGKKVVDAVKRVFRPKEPTSETLPYANIDTGLIIPGSPEWYEVENLVSEALRDPFIKENPKYLLAVEGFQKASKNKLFNVHSGGIAATEFNFGKGRWSVGVGVDIQFLRKLISRFGQDPFFKKFVYSVFIKEGESILDHESRPNFYIGIGVLGQTSSQLTGEGVKDYVARIIEAEAVGYRLQLDYFLQDSGKGIAERAWKLEEEENDQRIKNHLAFTAFLLDLRSKGKGKNLEIEATRKELNLKASLLAQIILNTGLLDMALKERFEAEMKREFGEGALARIKDHEYTKNPKFLEPLKFLNDAKYRNGAMMTQKEIEKVAGIIDGLFTIDPQRTKYPTAYELGLPLTGFVDPTIHNNYSRIMMENQRRIDSGHYDQSPNKLKDRLEEALKQRRIELDELEKKRIKKAAAGVNYVVDKLEDLFVSEETRTKFSTAYELGLSKTGYTDSWVHRNYPQVMDEVQRRSDLAKFKKRATPAMNANGGIDLNPAQMSMQVKKQGEDFKFDFNGTQIDAAQVTGATFTIRTMTPVTDLPETLAKT